MRMEDRIDSDYHPIKVKCRSKEVKRRKKRMRKYGGGYRIRRGEKILKENRQNRK